MKKLLKVMSLFAVMALTACGSNTSGSKQEGSKNSDSSAETSTSSTHTHTFNQDVWAYEDDYHYHPATCEHTNVKTNGRAAHDWIADPAHASDTDKATCSVPGNVYQICSVCGKTRTLTGELAPHTWEAVAHTQGAGEVNETIRKCSVCNKEENSWSATDAAAEASSSSFSGKLTSMGDSVKYTFYSPAAFKVRVWVELTHKTDQLWDRENPNDSSQALWYDYKSSDDGAPGFKFNFWFNGEDDANLLDQASFSYPVGTENIGLDELMYKDFTVNNAEPDGSAIKCAWVELNLLEGANTIKIARRAGYCPTFVNFVLEGTLPNA